jgi:hypothetical protein
MSFFNSKQYNTKPSQLKEFLKKIDLTYSKNLSGLELVEGSLLFLLWKAKAFLHIFVQEEIASNAQLSF